jgi:hypothetical protein
METEENQNHSEESLINNENIGLEKNSLLKEKSSSSIGNGFDVGIIFSKKRANKHKNESSISSHHRIQSQLSSKTNIQASRTNSEDGGFDLPKFMMLQEWATNSTSHKQSSKSIDNQVMDDLSEKLLSRISLNSINRNKSKHSSIISKVSVDRVSKKSSGSRLSRKSSEKKYKDENIELTPLRGNFVEKKLKSQSLFELPLNRDAVIDVANLPGKRELINTIFIRYYT